MKYFRSILLVIAIYGGAGWAYIAANAVVHPVSLAWPLTHLLPFPREDTFGAICFGLSLLASLSYVLLRAHDQQRR